MNNELKKLINEISQEISKNCNQDINSNINDNLQQMRKYYLKEYPDEIDRINIDFDNRKLEFVFNPKSKLIDYIELEFEV